MAVAVALNPEGVMLAQASIHLRARGQAGSLARPWMLASASMTRVGKDVTTAMLSTPTDAATLVTSTIAAWIAARPAAAPPLVVGLCAPQGAGKSTIAAAVAAAVPGTAKLSLDDLYLNVAARARLAATVHPLLRTRGVPGTHDVALGLSVIADLVAVVPVALPRFDKTTDAPRTVDDWPVVTAPRLIVLEGWCLGVPPEPATALAAPVNALEAGEDADGVWRGFVNAQLAGPYRALWACLDRLIVLRAPDFATVVGWRTAAEAALGPGPAVMTPAAVARFCAHYERLTRHAAAVLPDRADLVIDLAADRTVAFVAPRG